MKILAVHAWDHRETTQQVEDFARKEGIPYTIVLGGGSTLREKYDGKSIPHTFFINRKGTIVNSRLGDAGYDVLEREVRRIIK